MAAYAPKGAASYAASKVNLANPGTYDAAEGVAPTWAAGTGWTFDGATQYLTTGVVPPDSQTRSMIIRIANHTGAGVWSILAGQQTYGGARNLLLGSTYASNAEYWSGGFLRQAPLLATGTLAVAGNVAYRNGISDGNLSDAGSSDTHFGIYIGACNYQNDPIRYGNGSVLAFAFYNTTLTADQVAAVSTAMAAL